MKIRAEIIPLAGAAAGSYRITVRAWKVHLFIAASDRSIFDRVDFGPIIRQPNNNVPYRETIGGLRDELNRPVMVDQTFEYFIKPTGSLYGTITVEHFVP